MANPPPVQAQQPVNKGCTTCPREATNPCDVDLLKVKVEYEDREGKAVVKEVSADVVKRRAIVRQQRGRGVVTTLPYPKLSYAINERLARYDFVIESMADYPVAKSAKEVKELYSGGGEKTAKKKAKVTASSKFVGLKCERHEHGVMRLKHRTESVSTKIDTADHPLAPIELAAVPFPILDGPYSETDGGEAGAGGAFFLFEFFTSLFKSMTPRELEIIAQGCGRRAKGDPKARNADLRALVRVFRKDVWTVGVKIPALGEFKQESAYKRQLLTGQTEGSFKEEGRLGNNSSSTSGKTTTKGNGVKVTESERERWQDGKGSTFKSTSTQYGAIKKIESESKYSDRDGSKMHGYTKGGGVYGKPVREQVAERMKQSTGFDFVVARNGAEVPMHETYKKIKKWVETFAKTLADVQAAFKKAPQVGWKFTFEISALAGQVVLEIGPQPAAPLADGRYHPVNFVCKGNLELEVFKLKVALSFGVDAQVLDSGLVLKIEGSISIEVKIKVELNLDLITSPRKEIEVEGKYTGEIKVTGYVSLVGKTVAGAELSVSAGFEFKDGKLIIDVVKPSFELKGKLRTKPIAVSGYIKVPWWWDKKIDPPAELVPGYDLKVF